ncbi:pyridoxal-phosphate dependent enzyme [Lentzea sp. NPDC034063]|uniref:threonine ammonia-lyase n=1 Tax=unclassified Lentzea TaxID=2643253 RepID=UPI0033FD37BE
MRPDLGEGWRAVRALVAPTPLVHLSDPDIWIKDERQLPTGSFKLRGAAVWVAGTSSDGPVVTASSGNHAAALAWVLARKNDTRRLVVVVTTTADRTKVRKLAEARNVEVVVIDGDNAARDIAARRLAADRGGSYCSSHDDPFVIVGQSTVGLEILEARPDISTIVVPVGGGGLFAGTIHAADTRPNVHVFGAEPTGANAMALSLARGRRIQLASTSTRCDALRATTPGRLCWSIAQGSGATVIEVSDGDAEDAQRLLADRLGPVELSAAVSVAAAVRANLSGAACVVTGALPAQDR